MRLMAIVVVLVAIVVGAVSSPDAGGFWDSPHRDITRQGLKEQPTGKEASFLDFGAYDDVHDEHARMDASWHPPLAKGQDEKHFDDCEFNGGAEFIRDRYANARRALNRNRPLDATDYFGRVLHPVQDFYAHSNWVELGFPRGSRAVLSDLVDLSGAQSSLARNWSAPRFAGVLRGDILLGADDQGLIAPGWTIKASGGRGKHVPELIDPQGRRRGRLLVSGMSTGDSECKVWTANRAGNLILRYRGVSHKALNKDGPSYGDVHFKGRSLATLQTSYEWCRLVSEAGKVRREGLLLATWVRAGRSPHPAGTPCAPAADGPAEVRVSIESVRIRDTGDSGKGEIGLGMALYDNPVDFRRSAHGENRGFPPAMSLGKGALVPKNRLPAPLSICLPAGASSTLALYGWDHDQDDDDHGVFKYVFDDSGDDDELLVGFQRRFSSALPAGLQVARSADLEVRYRIESPGGPFSRCVLPQVAEPDPPPQPPPHPPPGKPDLLITNFTLTEFTVKNQGTAAAGPFTVTLSDAGDFPFSGLAAGASDTRSYPGTCEATHDALADSQSQVDESDETNNGASFVPIC